MAFKIKSLLAKWFLTFCLFLICIGAAVAVAWYLGAFDAVSPAYLYGVGAVVFVLLILVTLNTVVARPMHVVLSQVHKVLTGKPYKKIYTTRVDEIGVLANFFNRVTEGLTKVSDDIKDNRRLMDELSVAAELQKQLFPKEEPDHKDLNFIIKNRPASELGGDCFDIVNAKDNTYMYIGDVTGHGMSAGLLMAIVNAMIRTLADTHDNAKDLLIAVNKYVSHYVKPTMYMTMVMLCWNKNTKKMTYVGAGHERILIYRSESENVEEIQSGGTALGLIPDVSAKAVETEIALNDGDKIVLFTDGITEAKNQKGELFGLENLKKSIVQYGREYSAKGINHHISTELAKFVGDESQLDDMTLIVVEKKA